MRVVELEARSTHEFRPPRIVPSQAAGSTSPSAPTSASHRSPGTPGLSCASRFLAALLTALVFLAFGALPGYAQEPIELAWNPSSSGNPVSYTLYYGTRTRTYTTAIPVGNATQTTVSGLAGGHIYFFAVTATDALGHESPYSEELSLTLPPADGTGIPGNAADITLYLPETGATFLAPATVTLAASVDSPEFPVIKVEFFQGDTLLGESDSEPYSIEWSDVAAGTYLLSAVATLEGDRILRTAEKEISVVVQRTDTLPAITLTSPAVGATYLAPASVALAATVDPNGNSISRVRFYRGSTILTEDFTSPFSYTWTQAPAGTHQVYAEVVYGSGETVATPTRTITVGNPTPTVTLTSPAAGATYSAPASIPLAASVTANGATISRVRFYRGSTLIAEDTTAPYSATWSSVAAGSYQISAQVTYGSGSTVSTPVRTITVSSATPTIALSSPLPGTSLTAPASILLAATVTANGASISRVRFYRGTTLLTEDYTSPYSYTWSPVGEGTHEVSAQVVYGSGGSTVSTPRRTVAVVAVPPVIALTSPASGSSFISPATIPLTATVNANGNTLSRVRFYNGSTLLTEDYTTPFSFTWTGVSAGTFNLAAQVVYGSGKTVTTPISTIQVNALPSPWRSQNIGSLTTPAVSTSHSSGVFTVVGAGNLSGSGDNFRFLFQSLSGDGQIQARLTSITNSGTAALAGVMIRESLTPGSRHAFLGLSPAGPLRRLMRSTSSGGTTSSSVTTASGTRVPPDVWLRLVRSGNTFSAYSSANGSTWTLEGSSSVSMASSAFLGIAVASGSGSTPLRTTFSSVTAVP